MWPLLFAVVTMSCRLSGVVVKSHPTFVRAAFVPLTRTRRSFFGYSSLSRSVTRSFLSSFDNDATLVTPAANDTVSDPSSIRTDAPFSPWTSPQIVEAAGHRRNNNRRYRQHVNPLARVFQMPTILTDDWPFDAFQNVSKPLHLDIGSAKGGFILSLAKHEGEITGDSGGLASPFNYLGMEIRPLVAQLARERVASHSLTGIVDFIGCNANVDLTRILDRYHKAASEQGHAAESLLLHRATIQFPDPHFKSYQVKRRVVTPELIDGLAQFMPEACHVFLQSDVQEVLDDMRQRFYDHHSPYFVDVTREHNSREKIQESAQEVEHVSSDYLSVNYLGVPTERELSVLKRGLPVFRALFCRSSVPYQFVEPH
jgi:tRNA (guanine-N7-)-methyltransferase